MPAGSPALVVTAAIIRNSGDVLLARRPAGTHLAGHWEFPGGKIEPGETPEACLARELDEELGVAATVGDLITSSRHRYERDEIELLAHEVEIASTDLNLNSHDEVRWVPIRDLLSYKLAPADIPIAELLITEEVAGQPPAADRNRS